MARGHRNPLGRLKHVPGVVGRSNTARGTLITFADGTNMRVTMQTAASLHDELERCRVRVLVLRQLEKEAMENVGG